MRVVFKFGGTSLETTDKIIEVSKFIEHYLNRKKGAKLVVVVSAMGKTTSKLENLGKTIDSSPCPLALATLMVTGEQISASLLSIALEKLGIKTSIITAKDLPILAKGDPLNSIITYIDKPKLESAMENSVVIVPGFQGVNNHSFVTLGRGGSDTTAVALGSILDCPVYIFTDVCGYYNADPRNFKNVKIFKSISLPSALEGAYAGAKVLDKRCLELANKFKTDVKVCKSTKFGGTSVSYAPIEGYSVDTITLKNKLLFVKNISKKIDFLQMKNYLFTFSLNGANYYIIEKAENSPENAKPCSLICITGSGLTFHSEFTQKLQNELEKHKIKPIFYDLHPTFLKMLFSEDVFELFKDLLKELYV